MLLKISFWLVLYSILLQRGFSPLWLLLMETCACGIFLSCIEYGFLLYILFWFFSCEIFCYACTNLASVFFSSSSLKFNEERIPLSVIVEDIFLHLLTVFNKTIRIANPSTEVSDLIKNICKIFWSSVYVWAIDMTGFVNHSWSLGIFNHYFFAFFLKISFPGWDP